MYQTDNSCEATFVNYTILSANDFYAFGRSLRSFNNTGKYAYQGSEKDKELSDNNYYTHYRELEVEGRMSWEQVDPVSHDSQSPYVSMGNNPVLMNDQLGDVEAPPDDYFDKTSGKYLGKDEAKTDNVRVIESEKFDEIKKGTGDKTQELQKSSELINGNTNLSDNVAKSILNFYYVYAGFSRNDLSGGTLGLNTKQVADTRYGTEWKVPKGKFEINIGKKFMGDVLQNKWDFVNLFVHERGVHGAQFLRNEKNGVNPIWSYQRDFTPWHTEVVNTITNNYSWPKTSLNYKQHQFETLPHFSDKQSMQKFYYQYGVK